MRDTSLAAAQSIGDAEQLRARVLVEIRQRGGATCDEVEAALGLRHQTASARVNELMGEGRLVDSGERRKTRSGRKAIVWKEGIGELPPVLKWAGGKRWLLPKLRELRQGHEHRRWVEPFVGSMAVALGLRPKAALLRDTNPWLVNLHLHLQQGLTLDQIELSSDEATYYRHRDKFNTLIKGEHFYLKEAAELFYYLNRTCFNGLSRFNNSGLFNTPWGKRTNVEYKADFSEYKAALAGWQIQRGSFEMTQLRWSDFVYLDPPYDGTFTDYSAGGFTWEQQVQLAEMFAAHGGPVVASNAATARIINLYRRLGFAVDFVAAPRSVAADASKRGAVLEVLCTKNLTTAS